MDAVRKERDAGIEEALGSGGFWGWELLGWKVLGRAKRRKSVEASCLVSGIEGYSGPTMRGVGGGLEEGLQQ